jgi:hypothetical protein
MSLASSTSRTGRSLEQTHALVLVAGGLHQQPVTRELDRPWALFEPEVGEHVPLIEVEDAIDGGLAAQAPTLGVHDLALVAPDAASFAASRDGDHAVFPAHLNRLQQVRKRDVTASAGVRGSASAHRADAADDERLS